MRIAVPVILMLLLHAALTLAVPPYGSFVFNVGNSIGHGTDIADIPRLTLIGFVVLAIPIATAGVLLGAWLKDAQ